MVEQWIREIKKSSDFRDVGMILVHNGIVRADSKDGHAVKGMRLSYDKERLAALLEELGRKEGIAAIRAWINEGTLKVGDDIMYALVAGKFRTTVIPVLEELVSRIKKDIVSEDEIAE